MNKRILHKARFLIIFFVYGLIVIWSWFFLIESGVKNGKIRGIDLGPDNLIYVGVDKQLIILDCEGNEIRRIFLRSLNQYIHDYCFFINDNQLVIGASGNYTDSPARVFDLSGRAIVNNESNTFTNIEVIKMTRRKTVEKYGNILLLDDHHGLRPSEVFFNGRLIYKMTYIDFLLSGIPFAVLCAIFFFGFSSSLAVFVFDPEVKAFLGPLKGI